jgi:SAM-dependent methyltransferase
MELTRRRQIALEGIDPSVMSGLEIGPLSRPLVDKRDGYRVKYVDHDSTEALRTRFADDPHVRPEDIAEIDFVIRDGAGPLELINECFDYIIASHVFEHVPNPIRWLQEMYALLNPNGILSLIIPDRRFIFDIIRPQSSLGEWLESYYTGRQRPTFSNVFDQNYYWRQTDPAAVWAGKFDPWRLDAPKSKAETLWYAKHTLSQSDYLDVHCNIVTDTEFAFLFSGLKDYDLTRFALLSLRPCEPNDIEFFVRLQKVTSPGP